MKLRILFLPLLVLSLLPAASGFSLTDGASPRKITTPKEQFGHNIGDDYQLVNYTQETEYLQKLAKESDRMKLVDIGLTAEGRHQYMAIISSPENMKNLEHYREINQKLALAKGLTDDQAQTLAEEGRAVVWIDGGLHASETVGAQQLVETIYELNAKTDPETMRFLHDDIVLCTFANPDGMELVSNWYMRNPDPTKRLLDGVPRLWQKYIGHDDNRDFFASNQPETTNVNRILSRVWYPEIVYNHHQAGPAGTVIFMPPFRDPNSYFYDPLIPLGIEAVGTSMHQRLVEEGKPGSTSRSGAPYSTWFNGSLRTVSYFHNEIGLLTEIIGNPTPEPLPLLVTEQLPRNDLVDPIKPQLWHYASSIAYEQTNNRAVLDYASRERTHLLYNFYLMGKDSVQNGSEDHWTVTPKRIEALEAEAEKSRCARQPRRRTLARRQQCCRATHPGHPRRTLRQGPPRPREEGRARLRHLCRPARLSHRDQVRQQPHEDRRRDPASQRCLRRQRQALSRGLLRGSHRAGIPPAGPRHVRAAGPPQRLPLSRRPAQPAL